MTWKVFCKYCPLLFTPEGLSAVGKEKYTLIVDQIVSDIDNMIVKLMSVKWRK